MDNFKPTLRIETDGVRCRIFDLKAKREIRNHRSVCFRSTFGEPTTIEIEQYLAGPLSETLNQEITVHALTEEDSAKVADEILQQLKKGEESPQ